MDQTITSLLYSGEQTDKTGLQYLRARYYDPRIGRFNRLDPFAGNFTDPLSLHKYLYVHGDPINGIDPSGELFTDIVGAYATGIEFAVEAVNQGYDPARAFLYGFATDLVIGSTFGVVAMAASGVFGEFAGAAQRLARRSTDWISTTVRSLGRYWEHIGVLNTTVWRRIKATQALWPGTPIPRSFELLTPSGKMVWVHPNATEHLAERLVNLQNRGLSPDLIELTHQAHLNSLDAAVDAATRYGVRYDEVTEVGGWQLIFSRAREPGQLAVLKHAEPLE
jgi:RHS repeat-associated protein